MARKIKGILYCIKGESGIPYYVECSDKTDLFMFIAKEYVVKGRIVSTVTQLCSDGSSPKVRVLTDPEFKKTINKVKENKK